MNEGNGKIPASRQKLRSVTGADARAIFDKSHITHVVQAVLNAPVPAVERQQGWWRISAFGQDGNEVDNFAQGNRI